MSQRTIQFDLSAGTDAEFTDALKTLEDFKKLGWKVVDVTREVKDGMPVGRIVVEPPPIVASAPSAPS